MKQRHFRGDGGRQRGEERLPCPPHKIWTRGRALEEQVEKTARRQEEKCWRLAALARLGVTEPWCALLGLYFQGQQHSLACVRLRL